MSNTRLSIAIISLLLVSHFTFAQKNAKETRLKIVHQFNDIFSKGTLSNEEFMKKYVVEGNYFKSDSVKKVADEWMNFIRKGYSKAEKSKIRILKYSEHENEFRVSDQNIGEPLATLRKLEITVSAKSRIENRVNIDDLYVSGGLFILFNEENKIVSFAGITIGYYVGLIQF
jgi:hypothetical protein